MCHHRFRLLPEADTVGQTGSTVVSRFSVGKVNSTSFY